MALIPRRYFAYVLAIVVALLGLGASWLGVFGSWDARLTDRFFLPRKTDSQVVIVAIDDGSITQVGRWPWPRDVHAKLINQLTQDGALAIGYDVNFPETSEATKDQALADAMHTAGNVVLPEELSIHQVNDTMLFTPSATVRPIPLLAQAAKTLAFTNIPLDADDVARRLPLSVNGETGAPAEAFAYALADLAGRAPVMTSIPERDRMRINFANVPGMNFTTVRAIDVLDGKVSADTFKGKVVLVGATARNLHDVQNVPTSNGEPMSGVEIHASIFDTIVNQRWLREMPMPAEAVLLLVIALLLAVLVRNTRPRNSLLLVIGLFILLIIGAFVAFDQGWVVGLTWPTIVLAVGYVTLLLERWIETERERRDTRQAFSRYVSSSVVDSLLKQPEKLKLGGERRRMSVLFSDLRGFTTLSEGLSPEKLVEVLNTYLDEMTNIVFDEQGVLDKYIGDAVMAFWNAPFDQRDHALRAVRTAIRMRDTLKSMNATGRFPKGIELKVGVGINTGEMVVGNIGGERRYDYTVIGDSVNLASRTEGLCKEYGVEIIVTEATRSELGDQILTRKLDKVAVKGKKEPITIYQVICTADQVTEDVRRKIVRAEEALQAYFDQHFAEAVNLCDQILELWPEDGPTKALKARAETYLVSPPPKGWDGTWVMTKK